MNQLKFRGLAFSVMACVAIGLCAGTASAQTWNEVGDAGMNGVGAAQMTVGSGALSTINGTLSNNIVGSDADLYCIHITDVALFRASVTAYAGDSELWLFNTDGTLQVWNDDFTGLLSTITNQGVFSSGEYILGISSYSDGALNAGGGAAYTFSNWAGPDFQQRQGNGTALAFWDGNGADAGAYSITLRGVEFCQVPTPGAAAVLGLGGLIAARRRRA